MTHIKAALFVSLGLLFVLPTASRADGPGAVPLSTGTFSPSLFRFVTTVPDRGKGAAGGYQKASARLRFVDSRNLLMPQEWWCQVDVGMALRTEYAGRISPEYAAQITADVATEAAPRVMGRQSRWMQAAFCSQFREEMRSLFGEHYPTVGARVEGQ